MPGGRYTSFWPGARVAPPEVIVFVLVLTLLVMVASKWKLYPKVGYVLILLHVVFVVWTLITSPIGSSPAVIKLPVIDRQALAPWRTDW